MVNKQGFLKMLERSYLDFIFYLVLAVFLIIFFFRNTFYNYLGIFISICGLIIWIKGRRDLGGSFQISAKAEKLVTNGIYSKIRHPVYLGGFIVDVGFILYTLYTFVVYYLIAYTIILSIIQIIRVRREEGALKKKFGKRYIKYAKQTWI